MYLFGLVLVAGCCCLEGWKLLKYEQHPFTQEKNCASKHKSLVDYILINNSQLCVILLNVIHLNASSGLQISALDQIIQ